MTISAISAFLATPDEVDRAVLLSGEFQNFLTLALKNSGELPENVSLEEAKFRAVDSLAGLRDDLGLNDTITAWGQATPIRELIQLCCTTDRTQLIHSLWQLQTFQEIKFWLKALRAIVRFAYDAEGQLRGQILLAETIIHMVEMVESKEYVLPSGNMASDAITRNFGIRAKVFELDHQRRSPRVAVSHSVMDRLSRTLSKVHR